MDSSNKNNNNSNNSNSNNSRDWVDNNFDACCSNTNSSSEPLPPATAASSSSSSLSTSTSSASLPLPPLDYGVLIQVEMDVDVACEDLPSAADQALPVANNNSNNSNYCYNNNNNDGSNCNSNGNCSRPAIGLPFRGVELYHRLLLMLKAWAMPAGDWYSVFDRRPEDALANITVEMVLGTVMQYSVCPDDETLVSAVALMRKLVILTGMPITDRNFIHIFIGCVMLANKLQNDNAFGSAEYDKVVRVRRGLFVHYELILLKEVFHWSLEISDEDYQAAIDLLSHFF